MCYVLLLGQAQALAVTLLTERCFTQLTAAGDVLLASFASEGWVEARLFAESEEPVFESAKASDSVQVEAATASYTFCLRNLAGTPQSVNFQFGFATDFQGADPALREQADQLIAELGPITKKLDVVYRNLHAYERKEIATSQVLNATAENVFATGLFKLCVVCCLNLIQLVTFRKHFQAETLV